MDIYCAVCGSAFAPKRLTQRTCSIKCRGAWVARVARPRQATERPCSRCGALFLSKGQHLAFCPSCLSPVRGCQECGASFSKPDRGLANFCSRSCMTKSSSRGRPVGSEHWNWTGGGGDGYHTYEWHRRRDEVRTRDGWRCVDCGQARPAIARLHAHHLVSRADWGDRPGHPDDASNLVTVCTGCHKKRHPRIGGTWSAKRRSAYEARKTA